MRDFLNQFYSAPDADAKWQVCQQYHGQTWSLRKTGIAASCESDEGHFWITDIELEGYGRIRIASEELPSSNAFGYTAVQVEPPRTFADFQDCGCPFCCYEDSNRN
jgi:hypothetical protein